jgi:TPP-dependent pyruvate/acetoin dehydrogenase alpha subunit
MGLPYRSDEEVRQWISRDPIARFKKWLLDKELAKTSELAKIEADAQAAVDASIAFARQSKDPDPQAGVLNILASGAVPATQFFNRSGLVNPIAT